MNLKSKRIGTATVGFAILATIGLFLAAYPNGTLLEKTGSIKSPKIGATLTFSKSDPGIIIERKLSGFDWGIIRYGSTASISPQSWTNHSGFFALIDEDGRFWAYNGKDQTWIYERMPDGGGRTWDLQSWKGPVPQEFLRRIPTDSTLRGNHNNG